MPRPSQSRALLRTAALLAVCLPLGARAQSPDEDDFKALLKQGFELHQQARFAEAIPLFERARRLDPTDYFANLLLGIDLLRTGKVAEAQQVDTDRKSTRLNSSHLVISYAVFC